MDDMISRQAAIDAILHNQELYSNNFGNDPIDRYTIAIIDNDAQTIAQLPSAQQWIPCEERLPEEEKAYLVTFASGNVGMSSWHKDTFNRGFNRGFDAYLTGVTEDGECEYFGVVAWMKKPEPWKGGPDEH